MKEFFVEQALFDVADGVVGVDEFVVIKTTYTPNKAEDAEQRMVVGEDINVGFGALGGYLKGGIS